MATISLTVSDISRYPNPKESVGLTVRDDGPRNLGRWNLDELNLEGNEGGKVRAVGGEERCRRGRRQLWPSQLLNANQPQIPAEHLTWLQPIPADAPIEHIREVYRRDGVVHVRGLLNRDDVLATRQK
jgi:hypothetical protein